MERGRMQENSDCDNAVADAALVTPAAEADGDAITYAAPTVGVDQNQEEEQDTGKSEKDIRREARVEKYFKLKRRLLRATQCIICLDCTIQPTVALLCCGQAAHIRCLAGWYAADSEQQQQDRDKNNGNSSSSSSSSSNKSKCPCPYCRHQLAEPDKPMKLKHVEEAAVSLTSKILARSRRFQDSNSLTENIIMHMTRYDASQNKAPSVTESTPSETGSVDTADHHSGHVRSSSLNKLSLDSPPMVAAAAAITTTMLTPARPRASPACRLRRRAAPTWSTGCPTLPTSP